MNRDKAVFLDKDGTLIEDIAFNVDPGKIKLYPDIPGALKLLSDNGFKLVLVSNQAGVAYGYFKERELQAVSAAIQLMLQKHKVAFDGFYYCPHHPEGKVSDYAIDCTCRKPKPGMLLKAAEELNIDLSASWMIGDILNDMDAGNRAGCRTILIDNGHETEWVLSEHRKPMHSVKRVYEAAKIILADGSNAAKQEER